MRLYDRIDDLLALGAVEEGAFLRPIFEDFIDEEADQIAIVELRPGCVQRGARRQRFLTDLDRLELTESAVANLSVSATPNSEISRATAAPLEP